ncbi:hypothetical protein GCM10010916_13550 [Paenibacillus abyssi]|uniref:CzcB-like barrel-sandwich hybrid domain-containing protein n=1 Tax=Paenibacillus abyssi TaxID=1340531 RepID=A0A917CTC4_9BACL|nr:hypothetical protein GCM10010916_13550 [Paenibacillus abyssi]
MGSIATNLAGTANFVAARSESLFFTETGGRVKEVHASLGQTVKAGDLLLDLDTGDLETQVQMQRLSLERAQILYEQARQSGADRSDIRLREIDVERERISLEALQSRLDKAKLLSPIEGLVTYIGEIKAGDNVNAYQPLLSVADPSRVHLAYSAINTKDLVEVQVNMPVAIKYNDEEYTGRVLQTPSSAPFTTDSAAAERNSRLLILGIEEGLETAEIGDIASFTIPLQKREDVLVLPRAGVRSYMGRTYVQVIEGDRRKEIDVEVGLMTSTEVEIIRGLEEGQQVILNN